MTASRVSFVLALFFTSACGSEQQPQSSSASDPEPQQSSTPAPDPLENVAPVTDPDSDPDPPGYPTPEIQIDLQTASCDQVGAELQRVADATARCKSDDECVTKDITACSAPGIGCYEAFVNPAISTDALDRMITAYGSTCGLSKCKCKRRSSIACVKGRCDGVY